MHDGYLKANGLGAMEANSLDTVKMHLRHFAKTLGNGFPVQTLDAMHIQQHINRRCRQKGIRKKFLSTTTLKKEVGSMRACWNWGVAAGLLHGPFPVNNSITYPKSEEKEPFQTWKEIERKISRNGLSDAEIRELWDSQHHADLGMVGPQRSAHPGQSFPIKDLGPSVFPSRW